MTFLPHFQTRIAEKAANPHAAPVLIVAFGDSVTQGMAELDVQMPEAVYHARFKRLLEAAYPQSTFSVINAGLSGQTATGALEMLARDVIRHQPDLTLVSFGLNDAWGGREGLSKFSAAISSMIAQVRAETTSDLVLLTPTFMNKADNPRVAAVHRPLVEGMAEIQNSGTLALYAQAIRDIAQSQQVPLADVYRAWEDLATRGINTDELLANGLNHPTGEAHHIAAELLIALC